MKEIKAIIRLGKAQVVLDALQQEGVEHATVTHVLAVGGSMDNDTGTVNMEFGRKVVKMVKMVVVCSDKDDLRLVDIIRKTACTGQKGDGIITVANVNRLMKIRSLCEEMEGHEP